LIETIDLADQLDALEITRHTMSEPTDYRQAAQRRIDRLRDLLGASPSASSAPGEVKSRTPRTADELRALINANPS